MQLVLEKENSNQLYTTKKVDFVSHATRGWKMGNYKVLSWNGSLAISRKTLLMDRSADEISRERFIFSWVFSWVR